MPGVQGGCRLSAQTILGVDTGGTFTDFVLLTTSGEAVQLRTHKVLSTPEAPEQAILQGIKEMGLAGDVAEGRLKIIHGSTVATNAALEGKGVRTAFVTNRGFRDTLTIGRQTRPSLYALETPPITPPVPADLCLEISGRLDSQGSELAPIEKQDLEALADRLDDLAPDAIALSLLFSFMNNDHERTVVNFLANHLAAKPFISCSSDVLPEYREYERGIATWLNSTLGPLVKEYLLRLKKGTTPSPLSVMQSSGGTIDADLAANMAVNLLLSGPAGGLAAASYLADLTGQQKLMTFDMGGTSTDVALLNHGFGLTSEGRIGDYPVAVPMVDMHTIGAGGGSIAAVDAGGLLQVGPQSAGAMPGPACYGRGGKNPTVTDANLVLGRLQSGAFLGGAMTLDENAAYQAVSGIADSLNTTVEEAALGIVQVANEHMARALRVISVARGHDPAGFRLCCFGGAGGLHICALAEAMGMHEAMVPVHAGVLSAMGMFLAPVERQLSRTHQCLVGDISEQTLEDLFVQLADEGTAQLAAEGIDDIQTTRQFSVDLRYQGQSSSINIPWQGLQETTIAFHAAHKKRYGHRLTAAVELVNVRARIAEDREFTSLEKRSPTGINVQEVIEKQLYGIASPVPLVKREDLVPERLLSGPALVIDVNATTWLAPGWQAHCDDYGNLLLEHCR